MLRLFRRILVNYVKTRRDVVGRPEGEGERRTDSVETLVMEMQRTIKYDADRVKGFGREIMNVPGCEQLEGCIRCSTPHCCGLAHCVIRGKW